MKIAIVEDETAYAVALVDLLHRWEEKHETAIQISDYTSGELFLNSRVNDYDLVFMDIQMGGSDGVFTARALRERGYDGQLVFLTAFSEYVFEGYDVRALNYLLKPVTYEKIAKCVDYVAAKLRDGYYLVKEQGALVRVPYSEILYLSSANHSTQIFTVSSTYRQTESIKRMYKELPSAFLFCHRTLIVNMAHVMQLRGRELLLSDKTVLPVSLTYLQEIRSKLLSDAISMR